MRSGCQRLRRQNCAAEEPEGVLGQDWRWRVLAADVLPACANRDAIIAPKQASQLSGAAEIRMWSAADAAQQQRQRQHSSSVKAEDEPGSSAPHEGLPLQFTLNTPVNTSLSAMCAMQNLLNKMAQQRFGSQCPASQMELTASTAEVLQKPLHIRHGILPNLASWLALK